MKRAILVALGTGTIIASAAALAIGVASAPQATALTRAQYHAGLAAIEASRSQALAQCEIASKGKEVCRAKASAEESIRVADLEASFRRTHTAARNTQRARIEARYEVERAGCAALGGVNRDRCLIAAHATRGRTLLHAAAPYESRT